MKKIRVKFTGASPISFSRMHATDKLKKESHEDYEKRTWRNKVHEEDGEVVITRFMVKNMLSDIALYLGMQIPGKARQTYTKHFDAGVMIEHAMPIGTKKKDLGELWLSVPSNGKRGPGPRVMKCFPYIKEWQGEIDIYLGDETITKDVLMEHLTQAGQFIGMGSLRPRNRGTLGRFSVEFISESETTIESMMQSGMI